MAWYIFFEIVDEASTYGKIAYARSKDGLQWIYGEVVIDEPFHVSHAYMFPWQDNIYLVLKSSAVKTVRLYRARPFPTRWELVRLLLMGEPYSDRSS